MTFSSLCFFFFFFFFFNDTATTEIYTLSLHDALPISSASPARRGCPGRRGGDGLPRVHQATPERLSVTIRGGNTPYSWQAIVARQQREKMIGLIGIKEVHVGYHKKRNSTQHDQR